MAEDIEFKTWEEVEKGRVAQRNIEAANRILEAAGITPDNPNYKRYYNATLLNVHNAGRFAVKDTNTGEIMTYNEHVENMFIETLKNPEMSIEQYEQATTAFRDSFAKSQLEIAQTSANGNFSNRGAFNYQQSMDVINTAVKGGTDARRTADVKFPQEFYDENGGLRRLVVEIPEEFKSGADYVQEAAAEYGLRFEEVDGKKYFIDAKGNKVGPSKFFSGKSDLLQNRLLDKIGTDAELLDMADKELFDVIKSGDYQAFNALRAQRKGKGNPQLMNALSDEHIFHDVGKILNSADNMDKSVFVDEVKKLADTYKAKAQKVQTDASGTSWGKSIDRVMFSAAPYDVATQSTFRNWQSCMHTTGSNWGYIDDAIGAGSIVAYGYNSKNPQQMISRYLIHPYYDESGNVAYMVNDKVYGDSHSGFRKTVESVTEHFNEGKTGVFSLADGLYEDNGFVRTTALLKRDAEGRIILDELAKDGKVVFDESLHHFIKANDRLVVSDGLEVLFKQHNIPDGTDLGAVKNLTLDNTVIGKNVKFPDNISISGRISDGTDLSSVKNLTLTGNIEIGAAVKLPDNLKISDNIHIFGHIPDGIDLSSVKNLTLSNDIKIGKNVKLPDNICLSFSKIPDGTDLSSVKNLSLKGTVEFGKDVVLPDNVKFYDELRISGHIPDGTDLSSVKDILLYDAEIGKNVKLPDNVCVSGKIPDGADLSSVKNLTFDDIVTIGKNVKLPDKVKFSDNLSISGHIPDNMDLSSVIELGLGNDVKIGKNVRLPNNVSISGYISDGIDLSSVKQLTLSNEIGIGKDVKLPDNVHISGNITDGTDLSSIKNLTLRINFKVGKDVKFPDNVRIISGYIKSGTDLSSIKNLTFDKFVHFGEDVKLPDNTKFSDNIEVSGNIPDGTDLSSVNKLKLTDKIKVGKDVQFPDRVRVISGYIKNGTDLSSVKDLMLYEVVHIDKNVKLPDNVCIVGNIPDGTDLSSVKNLTLNNYVEIGKDVKLPDKVKFSDNLSISGYIPDGTDLSSAKDLVLEEKVKIGKNVKLPDKEHQTAAAVNTEGATVTEKTPAAVNAERTTVTEKTPAAVNAEVTTPSGSSGTLNRINSSFDNALDNIGTKLNDNKLGRAATKMEKAGMIPAAAAVTGGILAYEEYKLTGDYWAAAGTFGKTMKTPVIQATAMVVGTQATVWGAEKATSYYVYKTVEKEATEEVAKRVSEMAGKSVAGTIGKKVPLISVGFGIYYGIERFNEGDYLGAVGEVASGVCGVFPGIGTAASVAIDASLAGRDIYNELNAAETQAQIDAMFTSPGISEAEAAELQPQIDAAAAQDINKEADTPQDSTKVQAKIDAENAQKYGEQQQQRVLRLTKQSTASRMKNNTVAAQDICKELDARSDNTRVQAKTEAEIAQEYGAPKQQRVLRLPYASNGFQNKNQRQ